jgi:hypothetical protein
MTIDVNFETAACTGWRANSWATAIRAASSAPAKLAKDFASSSSSSPGGNVFNETIFRSCLRAFPDDHLTGIRSVLGASRKLSVSTEHALKVSLKSVAGISE